jgi:hypothetical protein
MSNGQPAPTTYPAQAAPPPTPSPEPVPAFSAPGPLPGQDIVAPPEPGSSAVKITEYSGGQKRGLVKLALLILLPVGLAVGGAFGISSLLAEGAYQAERGVLVSIPMRNTNWQDLGTIFEPLVTLPVKTTTGYQNNQFLLDSGAVISSLPREWAEKTGQDLAFLQRSTFRGFGGTTSFAYRGEMMVMLGEKEVVLPVVFTEAAGTKSLLGRKGFFEEHSIYFNHKDKQIEIRE